MIAAATDGNERTNAMEQSASKADRLGSSIIFLRIELPFFVFLL
jgi:hypothetical protein